MMHCLNDVGICGSGGRRGFLHCSGEFRSPNNCHLFLRASKSFSATAAGATATKTNFRGVSSLLAKEKLIDPGIIWHLRAGRTDGWDRATRHGLQTSSGRNKMTPFCDSNRALSGRECQPQRASKVDQRSDKEGKRGMRDGRPRLERGEATTCGYLLPLMCCTMARSTSKYLA